MENIKWNLTMVAIPKNRTADTKVFCEPHNNTEEMIQSLLNQITSAVFVGKGIYDIEDIQFVDTASDCMGKVAEVLSGGKNGRYVYETEETTYKFQIDEI